MDSVTRVGIGTLPDGLLVFQTDGRQGFWYALNAAWLLLPNKACGGDNLGSHKATQRLSRNGNKLVGGPTAVPTPAPPHRPAPALRHQNAALQARAASAETQAAQATATLETFEARLRRLEAGAGQAQR